MSVSRDALLHFVANAQASSPECAVTRIYLAEKEDFASESEHSNILAVMQQDVRHIRSGRFKGHRFADTEQFFGWVPSSMRDESSEPEEAAAPREPAEA